MERLGLGPGPCLAANPKLVYGRMTGWGQDGPMAQNAGHDINYLAITGLLHMLGRADERPSPPLNLVADMGGGGMLLAYGMTCALLERHRSGKGQVVDAAMFEGALSLAATVFGQMAMGWWQNQRGANLLDSGAHFYEVYTTSDDGHMAVGAIEPQFYNLLIKGLGLDPQDFPKQMDRATWPAMKQRVAAVFKTKTRAEWTAIFDVLDACVTPVLTPDEAAGTLMSWHEDHIGTNRTRSSRRPPPASRAASQACSPGRRSLASTAWNFWGQSGSALRTLPHC